METVTMDNKIVKTTMMKTDRAAGFFKKENVPKEETSREALHLFRRLQD